MTLEHAERLRDESEAMLHRCRAAGLLKWAESYQARLHALAAIIRRKEIEEAKARDPEYIRLREIQMGRKL